MALEKRHRDVTAGDSRMFKFSEGGGWRSGVVARHSHSQGEVPERQQGEGTEFTSPGGRSPCSVCVGRVAGGRQAAGVHSTKR